MPSQYCCGIQIEKNEMGGTYSMYGGEQVYTGFWWGNIREREHLKEGGVDGRIILSWIFRKLGVWGRTGLILLGIWTCGGQL
jgi:hypothetical protein